VGGLLWVRPSGSAAQFAAFDGNGNVTALIDGATGSFSAQYEYDTFGNTLRMTGVGTLAQDNGFRFSTKRADDLVGFILYEYRPYSPTLGRWPNRDPIEENGGLNLYAFCSGNPIDSIDALGLKWRVSRDGRSGRARAKPESGDRVTDLAAMIFLDDSDYRDWLRPVGPSPMPATATTAISGCAEYTIPNTIYIEFGSMTSWIDRFGPIPAWQKDLGNLAASYTRDGFLVITRNPSSPEQARSDLQDSNIYAWAYAGHGAGDGIVSFADGDANALPAERYTPFGIAFLIAYGCGTASETANAPASIARSGYKYSPWEKNVAVRGTFKGVAGVADGHSIWTLIVQAPGTNTQ
jgi:RHS repeat-associated protein